VIRCRGAAGRQSHRSVGRLRTGQVATATLVGDEGVKRLAGMKQLHKPTDEVNVSDRGDSKSDDRNRRISANEVGRCPLAAPRTSECALSCQSVRVIRTSSSQRIEPTGSGDITLPGESSFHNIPQMILETPQIQAFPRTRFRFTHDIWCDTIRLENVGVRSVFWVGWARFGTKRLLVQIPSVRLLTIRPCTRKRTTSAFDSSHCAPIPNSSDPTLGLHRC
jgi:hypothetical protein